MGLKSIHVAFITACTVMSLSLALFFGREYQESHASGALVGSVLSVVGGIALVVYGTWFLKKMRRLP
jgi:hypothetical protein